MAIEGKTPPDKGPDKTPNSEPVQKAQESIIKKIGRIINDGLDALE